MKKGNLIAEEVDAALFLNNTFLTINRNILFKNLSRQGCIAVAGIVVLFSGVPMAQGELRIPELPKKKRKDVGELPPQAVPVTVEVAPGQKIVIPLQIYGWRGRHVRYLLRSAPKLGKLSKIQPGKDGVSFIEYEHTVALTAEDGVGLKDRFTFAAQDDFGTSAAAEVTIKILEAPPEFRAPERISFGEVVTGSVLSRTITLANKGGGVLEGDFKIDPPWTIEPERYRLGRGEAANFKVTFSPQAQQEYRGKLIMPEPAPGTVVILEAMAVEPFKIEPLELDLVGNKENRVRAGAFKVTNRTDKAQTLTIKADARLEIPAEVVIPPGESAPVEVRLGEKELAGIKTSVEFHDGQLGQSALNAITARVIAQAVPAKLHAVESVAFGKAETGRSHELPLKVENRGGVRATVEASVAAPFRIEPARFDLAPGQSQELKVILSPAWPGALSSAVKLQTAGSTIEVPLSAEVISRTAVPQIKVPGVAGPQSRPGSVPAVPKVTEPPKSEIPAVQKVAVLELKNGRVKLGWAPPKDADPDLVYRVEARAMGLAANGSLNIEWLEWPGVRFEKTSEQVTALIEDFPAGATATVQVVSVLPDGRASEPSHMVILSMKPPTPFLTLRQMIAGFFGLLLAAALWLRSGRSIFGWKV